MGGILVSPFSAFHTFSYGMLALLFKKSKIRRRRPRRAESWRCPGPGCLTRTLSPPSAQQLRPEVSSVLQLRALSAQQVPETRTWLHGLRSHGDRRRHAHKPHTVPMHPTAPPRAHSASAPTAPPPHSARAPSASSPQQVPTGGSAPQCPAPMVPLCSLGSGCASGPAIWCPQLWVPTPAQGVPWACPLNTPCLRVPI